LIFLFYILIGTRFFEHKSLHRFQKLLLHFPNCIASFAACVMHVIIAIISQPYFAVFAFVELADTAFSAWSNYYGWFAGKKAYESLQ
jgi:hypothetical protein